jgi:hypothetical protein
MSAKYQRRTSVERDTPHSAAQHAAPQDELAPPPAPPGKLQMLRPTGALAVQRAIGNQAARRLLHGQLQRHPGHDDEAQRAPAALIQRAPVQSFGGTFTDVRYETAAGKGQVGAVIDLEFLPNDLIVSPKIGMTQTVKALKDGKPNTAEQREDLKQRMQGRKDGDEGRFLDRGAPLDMRKGKHFYQENPVFGMENQPSKDGRTLGGATSRMLKPNRLTDVDAPEVAAGTYGSRTPDGVATPATLHDEPGRQIGGALDMSFETAAIVLEGAQKGAFLGSVEWGFTASNTGAITLYPFKLLSRGTPTKSFMKSVELWNKQTDLEMHTGTQKVPGKPSILSGEKRSFLKLDTTSHENKTLDLAGKTQQKKVKVYDKRISQLEKELTKRGRMAPADVANKELELNALKKERAEVYLALTQVDATNEFRKLTGMFTRKSAQRARAIELLTQSPEKATEIKQAYEATFAPEKFDAVAAAHFDTLFRANGDDVDKYEALVRRFPPAFKAEIDASGKRILPAPQWKTLSEEAARRARRQQGLSPHIIAIARQYVGNPDGLMNAFMGILKHGDEAAVAEAEKDYNEVIGEVPGLETLPKTLGEIASNYFVREFGAKGGAKAVYLQFMNDYPALQYRVKPAYRTVFGEQALQTLLKQIRDDEFHAEVPDPDSIDNLLAKLDFTFGGPYRINDFTSSTTLGMFDAVYDPITDKMQVIVKLAFEFRDYGGNETLPGASSKPLDPNYLRAQWDNGQKAPWIAEFQRQIDAIWSGKHKIVCVRPGWEDVVVNPVMVVQEVPLGQQHFKVTVDKAALVSDNGAEKIKTQGGSSYADIKTRTAVLREFDLSDKIADPAVHHYLHEGEKKGIVGTSSSAYQLDQRRLTTMLGGVGQIDFQPNSANPVAPIKLTNLTDTLLRLGIPSALAHLHPVEIAGGVANGESPALAAQRATVVQQALTTAGVRNPVRLSPTVAAFAGATVKAAAPDPAVQQLYVNNWSRISAAHEFGHMIGLADEYHPAASLETVKKLISDGLLPPDTPTDHLSSAGKGKAGGQGGKQAAFMKLLEQNDLSSPTDFSPDKDAPMSTSIMTGGFQVMAQHFVTIWEALTRMTAAHVDKKFWKIQ